MKLIYRSISLVFLIHVMFSRFINENFLFKAPNKAEAPKAISSNLYREKQGNGRRGKHYKVS